jgi:2-C-methyl-D-erythritol 4-phosphate cytidylyltransferase
MVSVIIPAAGLSRRMGKDQNKQFLQLKNKEVIAYTLEPFEKNPLVKEIVLVIRPEDQMAIQKIIKKFNFSKVTVVMGGNSRQASVYNGIQQSNQLADIILIHDGARPFINEQLITEVIQATEVYDAVAVGVKTKDTIKKIDDDGYIVETLDRNVLVNIQTPQAFKREVIVNAHEQAHQEDYIATDDAALVEKYEKKVKFIEGSYDNIKITTPEDIPKAKAIISQEGNR